MEDLNEEYGLSSFENFYDKFLGNSMKQANEKNQEWRDDRDVDKAFDQFVKDRIIWWDGLTPNRLKAVVKDMKAFAEFYAQRCGVEIKQTKTTETAITYDPMLETGHCRLVRIGWADAIENLEGWHTEKEAMEWADEDDWIVHQVGWVLKETDDYILLSNKHNEASGGRDSTYGGLFKIPKPWIKYCIEVKPCC